MNAAIYYLPEAYTTGGPKLMGRNAAGESFLRGFFAHSQGKEFWAQVSKPEHGEHFAAAVKSAGRTDSVKVVDKNSLAALAQPGAVYVPGPGVAEHAWRRAPHGHAGWSICGITHTTSSAAAMDALAELITAPVQPWDAVICTATSVKNNVERLLQAQVDYLKDRLGITKLVLPQLPVIPLGIHTQDFVFSQDEKARMRQAIGAGANAHIVLFMGRLSFHAKAHPLAMYQALETAARGLPSDQSVMLVECGWHANEFIAKAYAEAAALACPGVRVVTLDGRKAENRHMAWAAADVFCSLSDNIQETFGIVPIEAMAAGLPVVVSDWDGYKDTVRDGIDGFKVATMMTGAGLGADLAVRHALEVDTYDMYCGHTCSMVAVDVQATANAFSRLFASAELRHRMGEAGRKRAQAVYDWSVIVPAYEALWASLGEMRRSQGAVLKPLSHPWPARMDPFHAFASYPTHTLTPQSVLAIPSGDMLGACERLSAYRKLAMVNFAKAVLPSEAEALSVLQAAAGGPKPAGALVQDIAGPRKPFVFRTLVWLLKLGVLEIRA